jgi:hypothetical protein
MSGWPGGDEGQLSPDEIAWRLAEAGASGFDPLPHLQRMTMPSLWLFGAADDRTPVEESVTVLDELKADGHDITVRVSPTQDMACSTFRPPQRMHRPP